MEIKLAFEDEDEDEDEEEDFIKEALETWLQMMGEEVLDREKLLRVVIACGLSCAYEYKKAEQVDDLVERICVDLKNSLKQRYEQTEIDPDSTDGDKNVH